MAQGRYEQQPGEPVGKLARTYRLDREAVRLLDQTAENLKVSQSELLTLLLLDGLKRIATGALQVESVPIRYRLRLKT